RTGAARARCFRSTRTSSPTSPSRSVYTIFPISCPPSTAPPACFFFNDTAPTKIYTLSLHDALPICAEFTENIINGVERPVKAAELFAFTLRVRAGNTDVLTDAEENVRQKLRAEGVM